MDKLQKQLREVGIEFESGLTNSEIEQIEEKFEIKFPQDLREFHQLGLPVSESFINWRKGLQFTVTENEIKERINWPLEGILFEVKKNDFWDESWGTMPDNYAEKAIIATEKYLSYPKLVPIYGHRYIPMDPLEVGNPVFSVYQMDIIYYGYNLTTYFSNEFSFEIPNESRVDEPREIPFWSGWTD